MNNRENEAPYIAVQNIFKSFGEGTNRTLVLKDISFRIFKGEFVSVMGPSGCGKSTLLYLVGGLDKPDRGTIEVLSSNMAGLDDKQMSIMRRRTLGFIFQFYNLVPNLTVEENVLMPVIMDGKAPERYREELGEMLRVVGMESKNRAYPTELSGGQQQRVAIARSLIMKPKILLADEATGNLDQKSGRDVIQLFREINREMGLTVLQVTHNEKMALAGSRVITMQDGHIESDYAV